jgi:hypothetical protein
MGLKQFHAITSTWSNLLLVQVLELVLLVHPRYLSQQTSYNQTDLQQEQKLLKKGIYGRQSRAGLFIATKMLAPSK